MPPVLYEPPPGTFTTPAFYNTAAPPTESPAAQDLDGVSFMLLTLSTLTEVLELSERDAVALCTHVSRVKYTYFTAFSG